MHMTLSLVLTSLLAFPLLANVPSAKIRVPVSKAIRVGDVNNFIAAYTEHGLHVNSVLRPRGYRLLHVAAREGSLEIVKHLIDSGAEVNATTEYDTTPLDEVPYGKTEIATLLEQAGAKYGKGFRISVAPTGGGDTPGTLGLDADLLAVAQEGTIEEVLWLLDRGAYIEAEDNGRYTALIHAAEWGRTEMVDLLLDRGANIEAKDINGYTALIHAAYWERAETVELLLDRGAHIEAKNKRGETALMLAAQVGNTKIVELLLDRNANIEAKDNDGLTPLMHATREEKTETVDLLLNAVQNIETILARPIE